MTPFSVVQPVPKIQAVKYRFFKSVKALAQAAPITQAGSECVGLC